MNKNNKFYMWQNGMCISYLTKLKQMEMFLTLNDWEATDNHMEADSIIIGACASFLPYFDSFLSKVKNINFPEKRLVVYGCIPIVNPIFYKKSMPGVKLFVPSRQPELIEQLIDKPRVRWAEVEIQSKFRIEDYTDYNSSRRYIIIQEGCSEGCIYCPHKIAIGREKSRSIEEIVEQIQREAANGGNVIVLEGENPGAWGLDLSPMQTYADLLKRIIAIANSDWEIHVGNFSPKWVLKYEDILRHPIIADIKIPIQSVSDRLLKLMGRDPCVKEIGPALKRMRKKNDKLILRSEIIIGLPTSTEEELLDTLRFVSEHFNKVSCFSFDFHPNSELAKTDIPLLKDSAIEEMVKVSIDFFKGKTNIKATFDDRGKICAKVTKNLY